MFTEEEIREIVKDEIARCDPTDAFVTVAPVSRQPWLLGVYWNVLPKEEHGKVIHRGTGVHTGQSEAMIRYRIRAMFAYPPEEIGMYQECEVSIVDHPDEPVPEQGRAA